VVVVQGPKRRYDKWQVCKRNDVSGNNPVLGEHRY
jgi:hypothetical protein